MEQPTNHHRRLSLLEGTFSGVETHHPMQGYPEPAYATARVSATFALNDLFLLRTYETRRDDRLLYLGHGVYGWDASHQAYSMYWFDTSGTDPLAPIYGVWSDDDLVFDYRRNDSVCRMLYQFHGTTGYDFSVDVRRADGTWLPTLSGIYKRESPWRGGGV